MTLALGTMALLGMDRLPSKLSLAGEGAVAAVPPPDAGDAAGFCSAVTAQNLYAMHLPGWPMMCARSSWKAPIATELRV
jgi:hypothetical protein